eukprot:TRINITY_DN4242_c1_g2_i1.p1 TRINITY_DN4242_c1_g2~~TRINITY_DN4242_c1_g2_i1.p1  ORF type:complete len:415 (+),score=76.83 TRINITY_DN4242_c1_g2_i1:61-1305(+)
MGSLCSHTGHDVPSSTSEYMWTPPEWQEKRPRSEPAGQYASSAVANRSIPLPQQQRTYEASGAATSTSGPKGAGVAAGAPRAGTSPLASISAGQQPTSLAVSPPPPSPPASSVAAVSAEDRGGTAPSSRVDPARKALFKEIAESNYQCRQRWVVPKTVYFANDRCDAELPKLSRHPRVRVTFSEQTTCDAMLNLASSGRSGLMVCGLSFANGSTVGGGYKHGSVAQEEDLCRRIPNLYTSLNRAKNENLYPFGPGTCSDPKVPGKYSDVLYTPDLRIARSGEEFRFAFLPKERQATVSLVSAAAPNINFAKDVVDKALMYNTVRSILIAPRVFQPKVSVLVLGAWGCGAFGGDPVLISELFAQALAMEGLGTLYAEVHFAIPGRGEGKQVGPDNAAVFRQTLRKYKIDVVEEEV